MTKHERLNIIETGKDVFSAEIQRRKDKEELREIALERMEEMINDVVDSHLSSNEIYNYIGIDEVVDLFKESLVERVSRNNLFKAEI